MHENKRVAKVHELVLASIVRKKMKISGVAELTGIPKATLYAKLKGIGQFNEDEILSLCAVLNETPSAFIRVERWRGVRV
jgi:predicted transcriptional regulator